VGNNIIVDLYSGGMNKQNTEENMAEKINIL
jgi:hypothetical protein